MALGQVRWLGEGMGRARSLVAVRMNAWVGASAAGLLTPRPRQSARLSRTNCSHWIWRKCNQVQTCFSETSIGDVRLGGAPVNWKVVSRPTLCVVRPLSMCCGHQNPDCRLGRACVALRLYADNVPSERVSQGAGVLMLLLFAGEDNRTTLMIKNIPNKYTQKMLLATIDAEFRGTYDFFYLPIDFKNKCNVGYAFINLVRYLVSRW
jgi:hypothetical protein